MLDSQLEHVKSMEFRRSEQLELELKKIIPPSECQAKLSLLRELFFTENKAGKKRKVVKINSLTCPVCRKQFESLEDRVLIKSRTQTCQHFMHYECAQKVESCPVCKLEKVSIVARDDEAR